MSHFPALLGLAAASVLGLLVGCNRTSTVERLATVPPPPAGELASMGPAAPSEGELDPRLMRRFGVINPPAAGAESPVVTLGRELYYDPRLSRTGAISCNSCHPLDRYGTTPTRTSTSIKGRMSLRNAPTVYNVAGEFRLFWDARVATLEEQALVPLLDPVEMGMSAAGLVARLRSIPGYAPQFRRAWPQDPDAITPDHVGAAIAAFERGLVTPARWDRYLAGDTSALSRPEKDGARLFANLGCIVCHAGPYVGGMMMQRLGVFVPWPDQTDQGRFGITHDAADHMVFKVPSLRNVARTAPYFHDGFTDSLDAAVRMMARYQTGTELSDTEAQLLVAWLGSLTGSLPGDYIREPALPPDVPR